MKNYIAPHLNRLRPAGLAKSATSLTLLATACALLVGVGLAPAQPTVNAPMPTAPPGGVLSMFNSSGTYVDHPGINWYAPWSVATQADYPISGGNTVKSYVGLQYAGVEFTGVNYINASGYTTLHVDVWTPDANKFGVKIVSLAPGGVQDPQVNFTAASGAITSGTWVSLDIPLSQFLALKPGLVLTNLQQLLWVDNNTVPGGGVEGGSFYIDNVYFYSPAVPLTVSITSPAASAVVNPSFPITANATVSPGTVTNVNFYVDAALVGSDTTSPFSYAVSGVALGARALKAIAQDSNGNSATSSVVNITVSNLPPISAYEPFNYTTLASGDATTASGFSGNWEVASGHTIVPGLSYSTLPVSYNALSQGAGQSREALANAVSSGTVFVSFLYRQATTVNSGNNGGNYSGLGLVDSTGTGIIIGNIGAVTQTQGKLGVKAVTAYTTFGTTLYAPSGQNHTYGTTNFIVVQLSGTGAGWTTGNFWLNPPAGTNVPGAANGTFTASQFTLAALETVNGLGGNAVTFDEIRLGSTYGEVVGSSEGATVPTTLALSVESGTQVSWNAVSANYYQPQSSPDGSSWYDLLGSLLSGAVANSVFDPAAAAFYQVLEIAPVLNEEVQNGGFETEDGIGGSLSWFAAGSQPPTRITSDSHTGTACASLAVVNGDITAQTSKLEQNVVNQGGLPVIEGNTYQFSFWAKSLGKNPAGGYIQEYNPQWVNGSGAIVGPVVWTGFNPPVGTWTQISPSPVVAPPGAVSVLLQVVAATGGIAGDYGSVLIDDVSLTTLTPTGPPNVIPSTVQSGAVFTATVQTNGVTATAAGGTVAFKTNSVAQSTGTVVAGTATGKPTAVPASYTLTAIYSGDGTYRSSTNTLVVGSGVNPTPPTLSSGVSGNQLTLSWPADRIGWSLQSQTNSRSVGLSTNWFDVAGSTTNNQVVIPIDPKNPTVFYRLQYAP